MLTVLIRPISPSSSFSPRGLAFGLDLKMTLMKGPDFAGRRLPACVEKVVVIPMAKWAICGTSVKV